MDPGGDPQHDPWNAAGVGMERVQPVHFVEGVDDDRPDPGVDRHLQLDGALVVAVHDQPVCWHTGVQRHVELASGGYVDVHALLVGKLRHGCAEERLAGIGDPVTECRNGFPATRAQVVLVVHEQGCAELVSQVDEVTPAYGRPSVLDGRRVGEQAQRYRSGHQVSPSPSLHISSGAETPSRSKATTRPIRTASTSHSRAWERSSSIPSPMTRQSW